MDDASPAGGRGGPPAPLARWREETWPALEKGRKPRGQTLFFLDDSGYYPWPSVVRTYAPRGQTPIMGALGTREHLSAISAISPEGKRSCHCLDGAINSAAGGAFLEPCCGRCPAG